ncbi:MAG: hypothetical protein K6G81_09880 [Lachnospiraceae bacterium]|nr:hypothetical protein [Lachnospiraceae bacterium]
MWGRVPRLKYFCDNCGASADQEPQLGKTTTSAQNSDLKQAAARQTTECNPSVSATKEQEKKAARPYIIIGCSFGAVLLIIVALLIIIRFRSGKTVIAYTPEEMEQQEVLSEDTATTEPLPVSDESFTGEAEEEPAATLPSFASVFSRDAVIEETCLWDEGLRITATGLNYTDEKAELQLHLENISDGELSFNLTEFAINEYMCDGSTDRRIGILLPGGQLDVSVDFSLESLQELGFFRIFRIQLAVNLVDSHNDDSDYNATALLTIDTSGSEGVDSLQSFAARQSYSMSHWESGFTILYSSEDELLNRDGIRIVSETAVQTEDDEEIYIECENMRDQMVNVSIINHVVNGLLRMSTAGEG